VPRVNRERHAPTCRAERRDEATHGPAVERLISGPLKAIGWLLFSVASIRLLAGDASASVFATVAVGAGLVWAGRWVTALRHARLEGYAMRHQRRVDRLRGRSGDER
jgi:hypothetical protein